MINKKVFSETKDKLIKINILVVSGFLIIFSSTNPGILLLRLFLLFIIELFALCFLLTFLGRNDSFGDRL